MKILCLHGRGSNNEIFQAQTAALRSHLEDFSFDFVQGTEVHTEGNWSLYTTQFSKLPQYTYYNPLSPSSVIEAEDRLLRLISAEGGFEGVLGYSGGAAFAAQVMIRHAQENPGRPTLFKFAVFINGGTPLKTFHLTDEIAEETAGPAIGGDTNMLDAELKALFLRPSNMRIRKGDNRSDAEAAVASRRKEIEMLKTGRLADGRFYLIDGQKCVMRYDADFDGISLIDTPSLHIRSPSEEDPNAGLNLLNLCARTNRREIHHQFGHDFPRGLHEMRKIADAIIELGESAV